MAGHPKQARRILVPGHPKEARRRVSGLTGQDLLARTEIFTTHNLALGKKKPVE